MWQNGKGKCVLEKCKACNKTIDQPSSRQQQQQTTLSAIIEILVHYTVDWRNQFDCNSSHQTAPEITYHKNKYIYRSCCLRMKQQHKNNVVFQPGFVFTSVLDYKHTHTLTHTGNHLYLHVCKGKIPHLLV